MGISGYGDVGMKNTGMRGYGDEKKWEYGDEGIRRARS